MCIHLYTQKLLMCIHTIHVHIFTYTHISVLISETQLGFSCCFVAWNASCIAFWVADCHSSAPRACYVWWIRWRRSLHFEFWLYQVPPLERYLGKAPGPSGIHIYIYIWRCMILLLKHAHFLTTCVCACGLIHHSCMRRLAATSWYNDPAMHLKPVTFVVLFDHMSS